MSADPSLNHLVDLCQSNDTTPHEGQGLYYARGPQLAVTDRVGNEGARQTATATLRSRTRAARRAAPALAAGTVRDAAGFAPDAKSRASSGTTTWRTGPPPCR